MGFRRCHQYFFQLSLKKWSSFVFFGEGGVLSGSFYWRTVKLTHLSFSWIEKNIWLNVLTDSWLLYEDDTCLIEKLCQWALPTILNWHLCSMAYQTNPTKTKIKIFLNLFFKITVHLHFLCVSANDLNRTAQLRKLLTANNSKNWHSNSLKMYDEFV